MDNDARRSLVAANLGLVTEIAHKYERRGVPLLDLIQAGNIGLITAAERFDLTSDVDFKAYAQWYIRAEIVKELRRQPSS